jgi:hypothetical protein
MGALNLQPIIRLVFSLRFISFFAIYMQIFAVLDIGMDIWQEMPSTIILFFYI